MGRTSLADFAAGRRAEEAAGPAFRVPVDFRAGVDFRVGAGFRTDPVLRAFWAPLRGVVRVGVLRAAVLGAVFGADLRAVFRGGLAAFARAGALRFAALAAAGRRDAAALARADDLAGADLRARLAADVRLRGAEPRGRAAGRVERERVVRGRGVRFFAAINPDPFRPVDPDPLSRG